MNYEALETELGGIQIYQTAIRCVQNAELKEEWEKYLQQTTHHVEIVEGLFDAFALDPLADTPGRAVTRHIGASLVHAMEMALEASSPTRAELVAAECVTLAETKDHLNWELLGEVAQRIRGARGKALRAALEEVEEEEDEHLLPHHRLGARALV
jgi:hypothetical protein